MGAEMEIVLVVALIVIFLFSFCGLLHKIRKTYENDQMLEQQRQQAENENRNGRPSDISFFEVYVNPSYNNDANSDSSGVFPAINSPPPYSEFCDEPPPKYADIVKTTPPEVV